MGIWRNSEWYRDAVIYAVDVERFADSDGDGIGDFAGLTERLDYIQQLGVTCLWLLPFYPTPNRDNGYDITDFMDVDPRLGTLDDLDAFHRAAAKREIRLIYDLVVHHTSDQHPWFQAARSDPGSPYRDYYVWASDPPERTPAKVTLPGAEDSVWAFDPVAGAHYLHQFYRFQPDLNICNPAVQAEFRRIMAFWRSHGADGFRVDAAAHCLGAEALAPVAIEQPHAFLRQIRGFLDERKPGGVLIAEADVPADALAPYFGVGDTCDQMHTLFNFVLNGELFVALARGEAAPVVEAITSLPEIPREAVWATFLRNLDELSLGQLDEGEQADVYRAFAPAEEMRIYGRGIRRRLAPMLGGDPDRLRLAFSLLLTLPGVPVLPYGDEIGLGDDLSQPERTAVRTAMQWDDGPNGGFSIAPPDEIPIPIVADGPFGYRLVNVAAQEADPDSFLHWVRRAIATRQSQPPFIRGRFTCQESGDPAVLVHRSAWEGQDVIAVHNLGPVPRSVGIEICDGDPIWRAEPIFGQAPDEIGHGRARFTLDGYGFGWLRVVREGAAGG